MITRLYPKWEFLFFDLPYNSLSGSKTKNDIQGPNSKLRSNIQYQYIAISFHISPIFKNIFGQTPGCHSRQTPSSPSPPFAALSLSVTATAFPIVHCHIQTPPPAIATCCRSRQTPSLPPPPFAVFHCRVHQMPSNATTPFQCLYSPQMAAAAAGGSERWQGAVFDDGDGRGGSSSRQRLCLWWLRTTEHEFLEGGGVL